MFEVIFSAWRSILRDIVTPPWQVTKNVDGTVVKQWLHILFWLLGLGWTLAGIISIGIYAPALGLSWVIPQQYQDGFVIAIAFAGGLVFQGIGAMLTVLLGSYFDWVDQHTNFITWSLYLILLVVWFVFPFALAGFLVFWYDTHFAPQYNLAGTGIVGATALKLFLTFVPMLAKGLFGGRMFAWFLRKIRGDEVKP